jgi:transcriptional regulator with XRE-family HTH domain
MSQGYSVKLVQLNKQANKKKLGVSLGRECIRCSISVSQVAKVIGVSRMTVYNWFTGIHDPQEIYEPAIQGLLDQL